MKKLFLTILLVGLWCINLNAAAYNSKCAQWEAGGVVYDSNGKALNVPGAAPSAYCWDAVKIEGLVYYNGTFYDNSYENLTTNQTTYNWLSSLQNKFYTYGEYYYGVYVTVAVMGYPQNVPTVKLNSTIGILVSTNNIASPSGSILNGKEYRFFIRKIPVAQAVYISDIDVSGSLEVYDGATLKDLTTIK